MVTHSDFSSLVVSVYSVDKKQLECSSGSSKPSVNSTPRDGLNLTLILFQNGVHREVRGHNSAFQWEIHQDSTRSAWCVECLFFIIGTWYCCCWCQSAVFLFPTVIAEFTLLFDLLPSQCPQSPYYVSLQTEVRRRGRTRGSTSRMEGPGLETETR